ncbi:hypothetical protein WA1_49140 [Scytonema hofmannii PCC 7110]|uniref:Uncharacterized protein n=1 Tax=Scytonema hofmannii PCC 7110 TaxID=128403 RepID=A0A139WQK1_9CYAN|nr:hypothetical protein [Scytonema hofmannii]KYC34708.1 hypothetical protein WA1_49140 [Scytonema hofmannii PCC 7110]
MNELPKEYPMLRVYGQQKAQPATIIGNIEGLCALIGALINAIAYKEGKTEVFDSNAETHEIVVKLANTHDELEIYPIPPYKEQ